MGVGRYAVMALALLGGCYLDLTAGASRTMGGTNGYGWEISLAGGVGWDFAQTVRTSAGADVAMARTKASDGKFGTTGLSYHGRVDVAVSGLHYYASQELLKRHAMLAASSGGKASLDAITGQTRVILDYGFGNETLQFTPSDDPVKQTMRSAVHSFFLGIAREYDYQRKIQTSFGVGPHVTYLPNDLVGDATAVGVQVHATYWFSPGARRRKTGSLLKHYTPSDPIKPGPEAPPPDRCRTPYGDIVQC